MDKYDSAANAIGSIEVPVGPVNAVSLSEAVAMHCWTTVIFYCATLT